MTTTEERTTPLRVVKALAKEPRLARGVLDLLQRAAFPWRETTTGTWVREGTQRVYVARVRKHKDGDWRYVIWTATGETEEGERAPTVEDARRRADKRLKRIGYQLL